jgi:hypothetical protein
MGYSTLLMGKGFDQPRNSVKQIVEFLTNNPDQTETEIQEKVWGYYRYADRQLESNKKYADLLRRAVAKGLICRTEKKKNQSRFVYNVAPPVTEQVKLNQTLYRIEEYEDKNSGNVCELFQIIIDGALVYERDYGSVGGGDVAEYIADYIEFLKNN